MWLGAAGALRQKRGVNETISTLLMNYFAIQNYLFTGSIRDFGRMVILCCCIGNAGAAVLLISEDLDEILELSDRIVVMFEGKFVYETPRQQADVHEIGRHMASHG